LNNQHHNGSGRGLKHPDAKPRLVFFRSRYDANVPTFLQIHKDEHVKCLSGFFQVIVIDEDCDYQQVCDSHEPDLALFELGLQIRNTHRLTITNTHVCPGVPKLAFLNADAWGQTRAGILSDMHRWGLQTAFSNCTTMAEHIPAIADGLFVWPNFVDDHTYRDYGESKLVPVLLTGCQDPQYPWRHKVYRILSDSYPSLVCPHHGYSARLLPDQMIIGERYARTLNAAWFAPTCGTVARELVRKHLEIPGCRACLITEASPALTAAGFVDMENCVFADEHDVLDKVSYLLQRPDKLHAIINAGHDLVHARHTMRHRDQIFQWFSAFKTLKHDQKIVQTNPFDAPRAVETSSSTASCHVSGNGLHLTLLREGHELFQAGHYGKAERSYARCLNYVGSMAEPKLGVALCRLYQGDPKAALAWLVPPIKETLLGYGAADPDPVEWAHFIVCLLCLGKLRAATRRARQFPSLHHAELDRARLAVDLLTDTAGVAGDPQPPSRASLHQVPSRNLREWIEQLAVMLTACGRASLAASLKDGFARAGAAAERQATARADHEERQKTRFVGAGALVARWRPLDRKPDFQGYDHPLFLTRLREKLSSRVLEFLHRLELKYGFFLPYPVSAMRSDECFKAIRDVAREENIRTALVIGAGAGEGGTEAFLAGAEENHSRPSVFCITNVTARTRAPKRTLANGQLLRWYDIAGSSEPHTNPQLDKTIRSIMEEYGINAFDAVCSHGSAFGDRVIDSRLLRRELHRASFVVLNEIDGTYNVSAQHTLLRDANYVPVARNPGLRSGYAIFKRKRAGATRNDGRDVTATGVCT
jgi:hypothetical protein